MDTQNMALIWAKHGPYYGPNNLTLVSIVLIGIDGPGVKILGILGI